VPTGFNWLALVASEVLVREVMNLQVKKNRRIS
jgi:hypothetical protein